MLGRNLAPALLFLLGAAALLAQEPQTSPEAPVSETPSPEPPTFAAEVEQVIVDMVVTDKKGNPVTGVAQDDLVVTEDVFPRPSSASRRSCSRTSPFRSRHRRPGSPGTRT